ncbi:hypothetical protein [Vampirovibrio sp.]|uniref:hypothetical protein n=1 Tax=Vampirovibrio sp. TaxID=2717857 RepID=UPI003593CBD3
MSDRRFYDGDRLVGDSINITRQLTQDLQGVIAAGFSFIAIQDHQADHRLGNLKSLGSETILPLYKSKNKRRDYDQVAEFHVALNYLRVLEPEERQSVSQRILGLVKFAQDYQDKCKFRALLPNKKKLEEVRDAYLSLETDRAALYLEAVQREFKASLSTLEVPPPLLQKQGYISDGSTIHLGEF